MKNNHRYIIDDGEGYQNMEGEGFEEFSVTREYLENLRNEDFRSEAFLFETDSFDFSWLTWEEMLNIFPDEPKNKSTRGRNIIVYVYNLWLVKDNEDYLNKLMYDEEICKDKKLVNPILKYINDSGDEIIQQIFDKSGNVFYGQANSKLFGEENREKERKFEREYDDEELREKINPDIWFRETFQNKDEKGRFTKGQYYRYTNIETGEQFNSYQSFDAFTLEGMRNASYTLEEMRGAYEAWNDMNFQ